jgi:hypothetical protein
VIQSMRLMHGCMSVMAFQRAGCPCTSVMTAAHSHFSYTQALHAAKRPQEPEGLKVKATK